MVTKKKVSVQKAKGVVSTQEKQNGVIVSEKEQVINLDTVKLDEPQATVQYKLGETFNKGNFQSSRVDVGVYIPCKVADLDKTYTLAHTWVTMRMKQEIEKLNEAKKQTGLLTEEHPF